MYIVNLMLGSPPEELHPQNRAHRRINGRVREMRIVTAPYRSPAAAAQPLGASRREPTWAWSPLMCPWPAGSVADPQHTFKTFIAFATLRANWNESKGWPT
jgi:hypothetical protein